MVRAAVLTVLSVAVPCFVAARVPSAAECAELPVCRCVIGPDVGAMARAQLARADAVFRGTVVRLDTLSGRLGVIKDGARTPWHVVARLRVAETWKGAPSDTATITLLNEAGPGPHRSSCDYSFVPGESYLVFAGRAPDGTLRTSQCSGTSEVRHASPVLEVLGVGQRTGVGPP